MHERQLRPGSEGGLCRSSETRIPMTASPKRVSVPSRVLSAAKAADSVAEGALTRTGSVSRGVKIELKSASADVGTCVFTMLARTGPPMGPARPSAPAFELSSRTVATPEPTSATIAATASIAARRRGCLVVASLRSMAVASRDRPLLGGPQDIVNASRPTAP